MESDLLVHFGAPSPSAGLADDGRNPQPAITGVTVLRGYAMGRLGRIADRLLFGD